MPLLLQYYINSINKQFIIAALTNRIKENIMHLFIVNYRMIQLCYYAMHNIVIYFMFLFPYNLHIMKIICTFAC